MAGKRDFTISLGTDGSAEIKRDFAQAAEAAEASAERMTRAYDKGATAAEKAEARRVEARQRAEAEFARLTGVEGASPAQVARTTAPIAQQVDDRRMAAAAQALRDQVDPAQKAQRLYNAELAATDALLQRGLITEGEHAAKLGLMKRALEESTGALGLNRMQFITAQSAVLRFGDSVIAGRNPLTAFALEAHKGAEILALDNGGMAGGLAKVARLVTPATIGIAGLTAAMLAGIAASVSYAMQLDQLGRVAEGFGRTSELSGQQLYEMARRGADAGHITVGAAEDIEAAILHQTRTSGAALEVAIGITQAFADAMGVDTKKAAEELGKAMADPVKAADEMASQFGYLTQAQVEEIHALMEQNRLFDAQKALLDDIKPHLKGVEANVDALTASYRRLKNAASDAMAWIGQKGSNGTRWVMEGLGYFNPDEQAAAQLEKNAKANKLAQDARRVTEKYGLNPAMNPKLEALRRDLAMEQQGNGDARTIEALQHAVRTFMAPDQQRVAIEDARSAIRSHAKGTPEWQAAQQRWIDAKTAGQVITEDDARRMGEDRAAGYRPTKGAGAGRAETLARQQDAMRAAAAGSLALADAYLKSDSAAFQAEARLKALTEATRKGTDVETMYRLELAKATGEQLARSAHTINQLDGENAARGRVLAMVRDGTLAGADMERQLAKEAALRPLLALETLAEGDAKKKLREEIERLTAAMDRQVQVGKEWAAQQAIDAANDNARADGVRATLAGVRNPSDRAAAQALANAASKGWSAGDSLAYSDAMGSAAAAKQKADSAEWASNEQHRHDLALQLLAAQASGDQDAIRRQTLLNQLDAQNIVLTRQQIDEVLAGQKVEKQAADEIAQRQQTLNQLADMGRSAFAELLSPDGIENWGQTFHNVIRRILTDFEQMALLNPLENWLFGSKDGSGGILGSALSGLAQALHLPGFASGTGSAPGGLSLVGEYGPELVNLPRGAGVLTASQTRAALNGAGGGHTVHISTTINAQGAGPREVDMIAAQVRQLEQRVPAMAVSAVQNATSRRFGVAA